MIGRVKVRLTVAFFEKFPGTSKSMWVTFADVALYTASHQPASLPLALKQNVFAMEFLSRVQIYRNASFVVQLYSSLVLKGVRTNVVM